MKREFGDKLIDHLMKEQWSLTWKKAHSNFTGIWEVRSMLPVVFEAGFEKKTNTPHIEIPLLGEGYIRLGITADIKPDMSIDLRCSTVRGDDDMRHVSFVVTDYKGNSPYPFDINFDEEDEHMRFLARFNPEKDIDWKKLKKNSDELRLALAICEFKNSNDLK